MPTINLEKALKHFCQVPFTHLDQLGSAILYKLFPKRIRFEWLG